VTQPRHSRLLADAQPEEAEFALLLQMGGGRENRTAEVEGGIQGEGVSPAQQVERLGANPGAAFSEVQPPGGPKSLTRLTNETSHAPRPAKQAIGRMSPCLKPGQQCAVDQAPFRCLPRQVTEQRHQRFAGAGPLQTGKVGHATQQAVDRPVRLGGEAIQPRMARRDDVRSGTHRIPKSSRLLRSCRQAKWSRRSLASRPGEVSARAVMAPTFQMWLGA
jgi:hypothetical protein